MVAVLQVHNTSDWTHPGLKSKTDYVVTINIIFICMVLSDVQPEQDKTYIPHIWFEWKPLSSSFIKGRQSPKIRKIKYPYSLSL